MQELIQIEVHFEIGVFRQASPHSTLEVVELLDRRDARHFEVDFGSLRTGTKHSLEVFADHGIGQLGLQVALTVESCRLDEALGFAIGDLEEDAVGGNLLLILDADDVADLDIGETALFPLDLSIGVVFVKFVARQRHAHHRSRVHNLVFFVTFQLAYKLFDDTQEHDEACRNDHSEGAVDLDGLEEVEDTGNKVKDVDQLLEL